MKLVVDEILPGAPDAVLDAFTDPAFLASLQELEKIGAPEVLDQEREDAVVRQRLRYHFTGDLSPVVKTQYGFHILKVDKRDLTPYENVKAGLEKNVRQTKLQEAIEALKDKAKPTYSEAYFPPPPPPAPAAAPATPPPATKSETKKPEAKKDAKKN